MSPARRCIVLRGAPADTARAAAALVAALQDVLWVGPAPDPSRARLGAGFAAVVLDLHADFDADRLARCQGFVRAGGALILRLPTEGAPPAPRLAAWPHAASEVGGRLWTRLARELPAPGAPAPLTPAPGLPADIGEQDTVVAEVLSQFAADPRAAVALLADRGRGKSVALGRIANGLLEAGEQVVLTGPSPESAAEALAVAPRLAFTPLREALAAKQPCTVLLVDEAAQVPVPTLHALVDAHPGARLGFATTVSGYEGTGRGFVLRFLDAMAQAGRPVTRRVWSRPIRWAPDDPLEATLQRALLLDVALPPAPAGPVRYARLDRDALAADEARLRAVFGLLVHAHYRTTPSDLHRLLDAPNLAVHVALADEAVVGVGWVAAEGGIPADQAEALAAGQGRLRGHALPDTLAVHSQTPAAATWRWIRSVRTAVHPDRRGEGIGQGLAASVHAAHEVEAFGTVFGATPALLRFRLAQGYHLVRLGSGWGERSGEPSVVMVRPVTPRVAEQVGAWGEGLAWGLPSQLRLLASEGPLDPGLAAALEDAVPAARPPSEADIDRILAGYLAGPVNFEAAAVAVAWAAARAPERVAGLPAAERALVQARLNFDLSWAGVAAEAGFTSVPAAMRATRRALQAAFSKA